MKILLTGNRGLICQAVEKKLVGNGHQVVGFDLVDGHDIRDQAAVIKAGKGYEAVVHLAALLGNDEIESAEEITRTNLLGTWNVLESARINGCRKVVFMSSVDALGIFKGEGVPDYFPIDDDLPCKPTTPYAISKKLAEEMCCSFSSTNDIPTICLRPPGVWNEQTYFHIVENRRQRPEYEWDPYWEYGAFIDVRDLADIVVRCLETEFNGYGCYLVASDDITTSGRTTAELARMVFPQVKWKTQADYEREPYRSLLDCHRAKETFGWKPQFSWKKFLDAHGYGS
ncbi:MAG: NAD(P)-dependent oxidoreductase [Chloroflexi bacterium]|nr:NAD(P)-dependent oxidoreductase [Chloroflexota bacterium]